MHKQLELQDLIDEKIPKMRAVLNCLLTSMDHCPTLDYDTIYNTLWSIDDDLWEIAENFLSYTK
ncbi:MAG: hypothetical protein PVG30_08775 [Gammaproteobacteria bacterium]|jgi:hypothetical protein